MRAAHCCRISPQVFRAALHDLIDGGWIFAITAPDGQFTIGRERRARNVGPPDAVERRESDARLSGSLWKSRQPTLEA